MAIPTITERDRARFSKYLKADPRTGCVLWHGAANRGSDNLYGQFSIGGRSGRLYSSHVVAWWMAGREIPEGFELTHHCPAGDNPRCCNVEHLKPLSKMEHGRDRAKKRQGRKSGRGLPYGVTVQKSGRFLSYATICTEHRNFGTRDTVEAAALVSAFVRDVALQVRFLIEAP